MIRLEFKMNEVKRGIGEMIAQLEDPTPVARDFGGHVVARTKRSMPSQNEGSAAGEPPASHHGGRGLRGSVTSNVLDGGKGVEVGTPLVYGGVLHEGTQEYLGGPIRPKTAKALAIPLGRARGKRPRDFTDLQWRPNRERSEIKRGVLGIGDGEEFEPLFALQTEVVIEPRPWLFITDEDEKYLADRLTEAIEKQAFGHG
ncbi:MAG TPA: hypothetical protein VMW52_08540 [Phycisphaerae bacterium]|nr:hypothetical protein [Phycisphaerae bacterium]